MFLLFVLCFACAQAQIEVNTTEGTAKSIWVAEGRYNAFFGVPYAGNVDGENRFKAAPPPHPYPGVFTAMGTDIRCAQPSDRGLIGQENCLVLNIFTHNATTTLRPVLVWLNAEEYTRSPSTTPSFRNFIDEGIVVVTLNFRLSVFGFLCLGVEQAPGNAGIKDIIQGLQWINTNIAAFGGNPNNVLLMGHGSAAALVDIVTMVPRANNLVHKAVTLSGSALAPWAIAYTPVQYAETLGVTLSYTELSRAKLAAKLASTNNNVLLPSLNSFTTFTNNTPLFAPCIENPAVSGNDSVLTDSPINILRSGNYNHIPYIAAYVTEEGTLRAEQATIGNWVQQMEANLTNFLPVDLDFGTNVTNLTNSIRKEYFGEAAINVQDFLDYQGDTLVVVSVIRGARERAATSRAPVRLVKFGFKGTLNSDWLYPQIELLGVKHGGIQNFLFGFDLRQNELQVMRSLVSRIVGFASNGEPASTSSTTQWSAITPSSLFYLEYTGTSHEVNLIYNEQVEVNPHSTYMNFWNDIYANYYRALSPVSSAGQFGAFFYVVLFSFVLCRFI